MRPVDDVTRPRRRPRVILGRRARAARSSATPHAMSMSSASLSWRAPTSAARVIRPRADRGLNRTAAPRPIGRVPRRAPVLAPPRALADAAPRGAPGSRGRRRGRPRARPHVGRRRARGNHVSRPRRPASRTRPDRPRIGPWSGARAVTSACRFAGVSATTAPPSSKRRSARALVRLRPLLRRPGRVGDGLQRIIPSFSSTTGRGGRFSRRGSGPAGGRTRTPATRSNSRSVGARMRSARTRRWNTTRLSSARGFETGESSSPGSSSRRGRGTPGAHDGSRLRRRGALGCSKIWNAHTRSGTAHRTDRADGADGADGASRGSCIPGRRRSPSASGGKQEFRRSAAFAPTPARPPPSSARRHRR